MRKMILLFSHKLTDEQISYSKEHLGVQEFVSLPNELQAIWSNFDPDIEKLDLKIFKEYIKKNSSANDIALIQGDFGACYAMVNFCKNLGVVPVYATTKREAIEYKNEEGKMEKRSIFEFRRFREYV